MPSAAAWDQVLLEEPWAEFPTRCLVLQGLAPGEQGRGHPEVTACCPSARGSGFQASPSPESPASRGAPGEELPAG